MSEARKPDTLTCTVCGDEAPIELVKNVMVNRNDRDPKNRRGIIQDVCPTCLQALIVAGHCVEQITWNFPNEGSAFMTFAKITLTASTVEASSDGV